MISALFWLFFLSSSSMIASFGRMIERLFLIALMVCVFATYFLNVRLGWNEAQPYILVVDSLLLTLTLVLVSTTSNFWPIWFSAFQGIAVATSFAQLLFPNEIPGVYINLKGFWLFPALISIVIGTMLDQRRIAK